VKRRVKKRVRQNPRVPLYIIAAQGTGRRMHYDGTKFSERPRVVTFKSARLAKEKASQLMRQYPILKKYTVWIEPSDASLSRQTNPRRRGASLQKDQELQRAGDLLKDFSGHEPTEVIAVRKKDSRKGLVIGELTAVMYDTVRDGRAEKYIHRFRKQSRPLLAATADGTQLEIVGGRFQMTEAGIEDR
jgi:hypothetical protein